jgi:hypothetical protein
MRLRSPHARKPRNVRAGSSCLRRSWSCRILMARLFDSASVVGVMKKRGESIGIGAPRRPKMSYLLTVSEHVSHNYSYRYSRISPHQTAAQDF